jgi:glycosyltransferase involved in cell wall biosynthesis
VPYARGDPRLLFFLLRAIRQNGYQAVDAHNVQSQFWGHLAAMLGGIARKVSTVHSAYKFERNGHGSFKGWLYEQVLRLNAWSGIDFIVVSEAIQTYLQDTGIPKERIALIHNAIQPPAIDSQERDLSPLESLGWEKDSYIVIVVARLEPVKGHTFLIEALRKMTQERPQLRCLIVGDGRARTTLEAQVRDSDLQGRIHFTGFRDDISALLKVSDAFCLPSLSEGLPYALLEACAHRLPLLVTEVGGMAELLTHKHTAFLVPPSDPGALTDGINWLIERPEEGARMGQAAFELVQQRHSLDNMIAKTLAVYQQ